MSVKLATFVVATLLLAQAFGAEQLFGIGQPVAVIRLSMDDDNGDMQSPISSEIPDLFNMPEPPSAPAPFFAPDRFSSFFRNLFDDAPSMSDEEEQQGPTVIRVSITSSSDDGSAESSSTTTVQSFGEEEGQQQAEEEDNPMARFSTVFQRMASMIEDIRGRAMSQLEDQSSSESAPVRRNCALLRACADEIDQLCSTERLTNIAGAISMCLTNHREELGDQCRAVLDKRTGAGDDDEEEEQADENADEGDLNSSVVITPIDEPGLELPSTDLKTDDGMIEPEYQPEDADAEAEEEEPLPAAELEQPDELPAEQPAAPLEDAPIEAEPAAPAAPAPTPAPAAAPAAPEADDSERPCKADVDTLCATEKANIAETHLVGVMACLHRHQSQLSAQCLAALNPTAAFHCAEDAERLCPGIRGRQHIARCLHTKAELVSDECKQAAHKHGSANSMRFASQSVPETSTTPVTDATEGFRVAPVSTDAAHAEELPAHVWPLAVAGGCFVFIVSLVAVLVYRRRRMQQELPITITLNNPSQSSATLSAEPLPYSPRVQERL